MFPKIIDEGRILRVDGGKRRGRSFLLESHGMGLHNVSRVESCPVWSYDGTQIEKEIASRLLSPIVFSLYPQLLVGSRCLPSHKCSHTERTK